MTMSDGLHRLKKPANSRCSARNLILPSFGGAGGGSAISLSPPLGRGRGWVSDGLGVGITTAALSCVMPLFLVFQRYNEP